MPRPTPVRSRRRTGLGAAAATAVVATSLAACGSDDDKTTTTSASSPTATAATTGATTSTTGDTAGATTPEGGTTTAADGATAGSGTAGGGAPTGTGVGKAPAANEVAIRAALKRSPEATKSAGTARSRMTQSIFGAEKTATSTVDTTDQTSLTKQTTGAPGSGGTSTIEIYRERGKIYVRPGSGPWRVTESSTTVFNPLDQSRLLDKAKITDVGGTRTYGGKTCREFTASIRFKDAIGAIGGDQFGQVLDRLPGDSAIATTSCIDNSGLVYANRGSFDIKKLLGDAAPAGLPGGTLTQETHLFDYGTAPKPKRPAGIDSAKPLGSGSASGLGTATQ